MFGDENSRENQRWSEANIGKNFNIMNNHGVIKGRNIVLVTDEDLVTSRSYVNWYTVCTY